MKKLLALFLVSIHLFTIGGQLAMHEYFAYKTNKFYEEQAAKGKYNVSDLTEIVVPVTLNNMQDWTGYENVSGQIQFQNSSYNYVKMKLTHNAMLLLCVPNYNSTQLLGSNVISAKGIKNMPVSKKDHTPTVKLTSLSSMAFSFSQFSFITHIQQLSSVVTEAVEQLSYKALDIPVQPPRLSC